MRGEDWAADGRVGLSDVERDQLVLWSRGYGVSARVALRARIVLACAEPGAFGSRVAEDLGVTPATVATWRGRFVKARLGALLH
jgi:hypothetical protein